MFTSSYYLSCVTPGREIEIALSYQQLFIEKAWRGNSRYVFSWLKLQSS
jgi:hypothetical protein